MSAASSPSSSTFKELFRNSNFVKNYWKDVGVVARNCQVPVTQGTHFGLKRDLPVPLDSHRLVFIESVDQSIGFTPFTDITQYPGTRLIYNYIGHLMRDKSMTIESKKIKGRFLQYQNGFFIIGLAGVMGRAPSHLFNNYSREQMEEKVAKKEVGEFIPVRFDRLHDGTIFVELKTLNSHGNDEFGGSRPRRMDNFESNSFGNSFSGGDSPSGMDPFKSNSMGNPFSDSPRRADNFESNQFGNSFSTRESPRRTDHFDSISMGNPFSGGPLQSNSFDESNPFSNERLSITEEHPKRDYAAKDKSAWSDDYEPPGGCSASWDSVVENIRSSNDSHSESKDAASPRAHGRFNNPGQFSSFNNASTSRNGERNMESFESNEKASYGREVNSERSHYTGTPYRDENLSYPSQLDTHNASSSMKQTYGFGESENSGFSYSNSSARPESARPLEIKEANYNDGQAKRDFSFSASPAPVTPRNTEMPFESHAYESAKMAIPNLSQPAWNAKESNKTLGPQTSGKFDYGFASVNGTSAQTGPYMSSALNKQRNEIYGKEIDHPKPWESKFNAILEKVNSKDPYSPSDKEEYVKPSGSNSNEFGAKDNIEISNGARISTQGSSIYSGISKQNERVKKTEIPGNIVGSPKVNENSGKIDFASSRASPQATKRSWEIGAAANSRPAVDSYSPKTEQAPLSPPKRPWETGAAGSGRIDFGYSRANTSSGRIDFGSSRANTNAGKIDFASSRASPQSTKRSWEAGAAASSSTSSGTVNSYSPGKENSPPARSSGMGASNPTKISGKIEFASSQASSSPAHTRAIPPSAGNLGSAVKSSDPAANSKPWVLKQSGFDGESGNIDSSSSSVNPGNASINTLQSDQPTSNWESLANESSKRPLESSKLSDFRTVIEDDNPYAVPIKTSAAPKESLGLKTEVEEDNPYAAPTKRSSAPNESLEVRTEVEEDNPYAAPLKTRAAPNESSEVSTEAKEDNPYADPIITSATPNFKTVSSESLNVRTETEDDNPYAVPMKTNAAPKESLEVRTEVEEDNPYAAPLKTSAAPNESSAVSNEAKDENPYANPLKRSSAPNESLSVRTETEEDNPYAVPVKKSVVPNLKTEKVHLKSSPVVNNLDDDIDFSIALGEKDHEFKHKEEPDFKFEDVDDDKK